MKSLSTTGIKQKRFNVIDRSSIRAKESIQREEDKKIFDAINEIAHPVPPGVVQVKDEEMLGQAFRPEDISVEILGRNV